MSGARNSRSSVILEFDCFKGFSSSIIPEFDYSRDSLLPAVRCILRLLYVIFCLDKHFLV